MKAEKLKGGKYLAEGDRRVNGGGVQETNMAKLHDMLKLTVFTQSSKKKEKGDRDVRGNKIGGNKRGW